MEQNARQGSSGGALKRWPEKSSEHRSGNIGQAVDRC
jgi:hypothetical protein